MLKLKTEAKVDFFFQLFECFPRILFFRFFTCYFQSFAKCETKPNFFVLTESTVPHFGRQKYEVVIIMRTEVYKFFLPYRPMYESHWVTNQ